MKYDCMVSFPVSRQRSTAKKARKNSDSIKAEEKPLFRRHLTFSFTLKTTTREGKVSPTSDRVISSEP